MSEEFIGLLGILFKPIDGVLSNLFEFFTLLGLEGLSEVFIGLLCILFGLFNVFCEL